MLIRVAKLVLMLFSTAAISSDIEPELSMTKMMSTGLFSSVACELSTRAGAVAVEGGAAVAWPAPTSQCPCRAVLAVPHAVLSPTSCSRRCRSCRGRNTCPRRSSCRRGRSCRRQPGEPATPQPWPVRSSELQPDAKLKPPSSRQVAKRYLMGRLYHVRAPLGLRYVGGGAMVAPRSRRAARSRRRYSARGISVAPRLRR